MVNLGGGYVSVPQQAGEAPDVGPCLQQMNSKSVVDGAEGGWCSDGLVLRRER